MCEKCRELDKRIERYRELESLLVDQQTLDGLKTLIEQHEAEKRSLHPEQK